MEKDKQALISVIVPIHNGQDYISACVASIQAQNIGNITTEIILIDDGSTDQTGEICEALRQKDARIHLITMADMGVSCARNAGLSIATGDYLTFVDADDRLLPGTLYRLWELADRTGSDITGCDFAMWDNEADYSRLVATDKTDKTTVNHHEISYTGHEFIDKGILGRDTRCWSKLYRKTSIANLRFEEGLSIGEDMLFLLAAAGTVNKITIADFKGYAYFQNPHGAMKRIFKASYMDQITCWQLAAERIGKLRPDLQYKAVGNIMVAILLTVGKIAELPLNQQKQYRDKLKFCHQQLKTARKVPAAFAGLDKGYQIKTIFFEKFPRLYVKAYHQWKRRGHNPQAARIIFYMHAGSGNHGCEAIVNSVCHMLDTPVAVLSNSVAEDQTYSLAGACTLLQERKFSEHRLEHVLYYLYRKLTGDRESFIRYRYRPVFGKKVFPLAISIGGDNYCYDIMVKDLILANRAFRQKGAATVLLGCSIEPELLKQPEIVADMNRYRAIFARESITYEALKPILQPETALYLFPDPAFTLPKKELPLPPGFVPENTLGVNVSPMIRDKEQAAGITMASYRALLQYVIDSTDMQIALIPHVVWTRNDDREPLHELYRTFAATGRVVMIPDASCTELKGYIARCRLFVGARTHATIAAYSSLVPTLVVGYSVKARGIARDLFGTEEHFVLPVQTLKNGRELVTAFQWLMAEEGAIRRKLADRMPEYGNRALQQGKEVEKLWAELNRQPEI